MPFTLDQIRQALAEHQPHHAGGAPRQVAASVALVLAGEPDRPAGSVATGGSRDRPAGSVATGGSRDRPAGSVATGGSRDLSLCVIRRAERTGDPWSGHLALPGGRASTADPHPRAVAERETIEEVGLDLETAAYLGALSEVPVRLGGGMGEMVLSPFVYHIGPGLPPFTASDEVAEAFWVPLAELWDPANASHVEWERHGARQLYPAIRCRGHAIWGLTFRVLTLFSDLLDAPLPYLEEIPGLGRDPVTSKP